MDLRYSLLILPYFLTGIYGIECYVCEDQESNRDKCITTVRICDPEIHDACSTLVRWGVTQYWLPAVKRVYYVSKACDSMKSCMARKRKLEETRCYRDWWADWVCEDCCTGDRCNYYVTLAGGRTSASWLTSFLLLWYLSLIL